MENTPLSLLTDWDIPAGVTIALLTASVVYIRSWIALRRSRPATLPVWRLAAFLAGLLAVFVAVASPLDTFSEALLFMHMAQHFVLMSLAPPLIVMGSPLVPILRGLPAWIVQRITGPLIRSSRLRLLKQPLLTDQFAAGAFMWVLGSVVFLVPATVWTVRLLSNGRLVRPCIPMEATRALAR